MRPSANNFIDIHELPSTPLPNRYILRRLIIYSGMPMRHSRLLVTSAIGIIISAGAAQAVVDPGSARPEFLRNENTIETPRPAVTSAPIVSDEEKTSHPIKGEATFILNDVQFEGATQFSAEQMRALYADKLGKKISVSELNALVANVTAFYRNKGFILSRAVLPPQKVGSGVVKIRIVEGFVNDVRLEGDVGKDPTLLQKYAAKIKASKPLNSKDLERYLLLMEDLPGVSARAVLRPAEKVVGASDVIVTITRKKVEGAVTLDNRGSRFLGPIQGGLTVAYNNLFDMNEQTQLRLLNSVFQPAELQFGELRHEEQVGSEGTKFIASGSYARTRPGASLDILNIDGWSATGTAGFVHPLYRSRQNNWFLSSDFTWRDSDVQITDVTLYRDEIRTLRVGTTYDFMDSLFAINRLEGSVSKGLNWWNDNGNNSFSRANGQTSFLKFNAKATRIQPISGPWTAFGSVSGQYSNEALLAAEEFAIGGEEFGSAYDSAEITGDHGLAGRLELQYSQPVKNELVENYQLYGFYDVGRVWNRDIIAASEPSHISLASGGFGSRFNVTKAFSGGLEFAVPLTKPISANGQDGEAPRIFFNLQYRY
jgi:hemolysin activation/secretion protein